MALARGVPSARFPAAGGLNAAHFTHRHVCLTACSWRAAPAAPAPAAFARRRRAVSCAADKRTASVQVDAGGSIEQKTDATSRLVKVQLDFPLGFVLEQDGQDTVVAELTPGGAAERGGVQLGDVVRGTTAAVMTMTYGTVGLMFGGNGRPRLTRVLVPTKGWPFSKVADALRSNAELGDSGGVTLVLERRGVDGGGGGDSGGDDDADSGPRVNADAEGSISGDGGDQAPGQLFDPRLFD